MWQIHHRTYRIGWYRYWELAVGQNGALKKAIFDIKSLHCVKSCRLHWLVAFLWDRFKAGQQKLFIVQLPQLREWRGHVSVDMRGDPSLLSQAKPRLVFSTKTPSLSTVQLHFVSSQKALPDTFCLGCRNRHVGLMNSRLLPRWHIRTDLKPTVDNSCVNQLQRV